MNRYNQRFIDLIELVRHISCGMFTNNKMIALFVYSILVIACNQNRIDVVYGKQWKWAGGYFINDFIEFDEQLILQNDSTILLNGLKIGRLLSVNQKQLIISNDTMEGVYITMDKFK